MKTDDHLLETSSSTEVTHEASGKVKSVEGSTSAPSKGNAKPKAKDANH